MPVKRLLASLAVLASSQAYGLCAVVSSAPASFGSVSSSLVLSAVQSASTTNAGLQCTGSLLTLLRSDDHFFATFKPIANTTGLVGPSGDVIPYTLYANNSLSFPITRNVAYDFARNGIIDALGLLNGTTPKSAPIYLKTQVGANVAAGLYQETLSVYWNIDYCWGIGVGSLCLGRQKLEGTTNLTISLTVTNDCQITTPNISFGSAPVVAGFGTVNGNVNIACTKGSYYSVGLDDGQNVAGGRRRMKSAASNYLAYDLFKSAGTVRWGKLTSARRASTDADINPGAGTGIGSQVFNYNAKVYTDQATPPAGAYQDSIILDVQF
ncbi:spore coat protein U domain-containing protein [Pseudomonas sp. JQ170]|uniref:Csu type fimbrial protein n=1 Tax=unclassified Pseudomonas TaxID=196821 RepID=UPI002652C4B0|nr:MULTISPECIES: spore coat U domain-containing protein [unclassified Pseudomonas]MDN7142018.1 spore coat protein U domain-containing protein [Pseudomonas sp. JQ170]WRO78313.1 spore coat U domain-containing protein [Pseudomonas sp. 170C]